MYRLPLFLFALLVSLSACDWNSSLATAKLSPSSLEVVGPDTLLVGESVERGEDVYPFSVTITNTTGKTLYIDGRDVDLYRVATDGTHRVAYAQDERAHAGPMTPIASREGIEAGVVVSTLPEGRVFPNIAQWLDEGPVDGEYVIGAVLYAEQGSLERQWRNGEVAPDEVSFSAPFTLTFVEAER